MQTPVLLLCCLLLDVVSSAPLSSDGDSSASSSLSDSDEDLQLPVVGVASPQAPPTAPNALPSVIVKVEDTKTNITLSFAIFIITEEEEGSGTDGGGRSDDNSQSDDISDDVSSEEMTRQGPQPIAEEYADHMITKRHKRLSSEEMMMGDQPMLTFSDDADEFNSSSSWDYFISSSGSNVSDESDDFNNSTESREMNTQPVRSILDFFHDIITRPDEPTLSFSDDFSNSSSLEITHLSPNLQGSTLNPDSQSGNNNQQGALGVDTVDKVVLDPVSQDVMSSSSEKTSWSQDHVDSTSITEDFRLGFRLQNVFRSFQEVVDLISVMGAKASYRKVLGSTPFTGSQVAFLLNSEESDEKLEFVSTDPKNQTGVSSDGDSNESLESTVSSIQQGPTTSSVSDLISPDSDSEDVQDISVKSIQAHNGVRLNPVSPDQDVAPTTLSILKDTVSKGDSRSFSKVDVSLTSDSSEESQESTTPGLSPVSRVDSPEVNSSSGEVLLGLKSSSSPLLVSSNITPSPQTPPESGSLRSDSDESDSSEFGSESDSPGAYSGNNSQSTEPDLNPATTWDSHLSPESSFNPSLSMNFSSSSEISQEQAEESPSIKIPTNANSDSSKEAKPTADYSTNTASIPANPEASSDAKPGGGGKDTEADLSTEAANDSSSDVSIEADPTTATLYGTVLPSMHVSSDASTNTGNGLSVEEEDGASTEANTDSVVSIKPTASTEHSTSPPDSGASTDANASVEKEHVNTKGNPDANIPAPNQIASSEENVASPLPPPPPRRKRPYRFGYLSPVSHSYSNQPVAKETASKQRLKTIATETLAVRHHQLKTPQQHLHNLNVYFDPLHDFFNSRRLTVNRKQARVSVAAAANPALSSSEETN